MKKETIFNILMGFFAGFVSGFLGAGGGLLLIPYMTVNLKKGEVTARATTILCIFGMVLTSSFFYFRKQFIDWSLSIKCAIGGMFGAYIGSKILMKLNSNVLKLCFIAFLIYAGISMMRNG